MLRFFVLFIILTADVKIVAMQGKVLFLTWRKLETIGTFKTSFPCLPFVAVSRDSFCG